jgi:hypothetical protein
VWGHLHQAVRNRKAPAAVQHTASSRSMTLGQLYSLTEDILCQLVVSVEAPDASCLAAQVRHLVHVHQQAVRVPAAGVAEKQQQAGVSGESRWTPIILTAATAARGVPGVLG